MKKNETAKNPKAGWVVILAFCLGLSGSVVPASAAGKKEGARLAVELTGGRLAEGELLAVKGRSLVLGDFTDMEAKELATDEIVRVRIIRKSRFFPGLGIGLLAGAASGAVLGFISGDDPPGWFSFTAGQKAAMGALGLGLLGAPIGGLAGAIGGTDQRIEWAAMPFAQRERALEKLREMSRFPDEYVGPVSRPQNDPQPAAELKPASKDGPKPTDRPRTGRFHIGIAPAYFQSDGMGRFEQLIEDVGFGDSYSYSGGFFSSTGGTVTFPQKGRDTSVLADIQVEYSLTPKWAVGFLHSSLGRHEVEGRRALKGLDYRDWYDAECCISGQYSGTSFFLTGAYFPVPDGFLKRTAVRVGGGVGLSPVEITYGDHSYLPSNGPSESVSRLALSGLAFIEVHWFFNRHWSLGLATNYKYVPVRVQERVVSCPYFYYASGGPEGFREEVLSVSFPEYSLNVGGFSFGLSLRYRL